MRMAECYNNRTPMQSNWQQVWNRRTITHPTQNNDPEKILSALIAVDGFDSSLSAITPKSWMGYVELILNEIKINKGGSIFEIGCGAGALLYSFHLAGHKVGGIDYSHTMVSVAQKYLPNMDIAVCEATLCNTIEQYDAVLSNSAFSYFPNYDYAKAVMEKMFLKAKKVISILDVPDFARKEESEHMRGLKIVDYKSLYKDIKHLYFAKEWFTNFAREKNCRIKIINQNIENYGNNPFRFNCFIWK